MYSLSSTALGSLPIYRFLQGDKRCYLALWRNPQLITLYLFVWIEFFCDKVLKSWYGGNPFSNLHLRLGSSSFLARKFPFIAGWSSGFDDLICIDPLIWPQLYGRNCHTGMFIQNSLFHIKKLANYMILNIGSCSLGTVRTKPANVPAGYVIIPRRVNA